MQKTILLVEDEEAILEMLEMILQQADFSTLSANTAEQAQEILADNTPDLMVLDWMLPGISGVELARRLKKDPTLKKLPIIMLTARGEEDDKVRGLEIGADDYMTKPFSPKELVARIHAVLRRTSPNNNQPLLQQGVFQLNTDKHILTINNQILDVSPLEFKLIHFFMQNPDKVFSRTQLLDQVWGRSVYVEERTVDVHIRRLRKVLAEHGCKEAIQTVRGFGYRFSATEDK
ncbi:phosphate regulon transcriptional regulator PhoB [methane-oxidizing endosymbiont of Gigantopelta aegis]|uniref:phosphate regulon transcriptional regulator PhoB n=1 Tax=methane-oxidizing endosymbiont of Gigantopelta aegis TaxID=2794938 RepID=UPI0018DB3B33|nr:phosphate regulon transcriptional regulator PhoB [methane-oxidizing endosymbiont of Gigantopelta aegis]